MLRPIRRHRPAGFTLIEILVVMSITVVMAGVCMCLVSRARKSGQLVKEMNAARNLTTALGLHASDRGGQLPYGYDGSLGSLDVSESGQPGNLLHGGAAHRYPYRLAPYFGYKFDGTTVIDRSLEYMLKNRDSYMISLLPAMGMNVYGVGGYIEEGTTSLIPGSIRSMSQAVSPETMIAFVSSRTSYRDTDEIAPGFHMATPRKTPGGDWAENYDPEDPSSWGNVDLRYDDKAAAAFLDGSVALLNRSQVRDMRKWNNDAARLNDPDYRPTSNPTGGGRGR